jgi:hypothetical protein
LDGVLTAPPPTRGETAALADPPLAMTWAAGVPGVGDDRETGLSGLGCGLDEVTRAEERDGRETGDVDDIFGELGITCQVFDVVYRSWRVKDVKFLRQEMRIDAIQRVLGVARVVQVSTKKQVVQRRNSEAKAISIQLIGCCRPWCPNWWLSSSRRVSFATHLRFLKDYD